MDENIKEITQRVESKLEGELGSEFQKAKARGQYEKQLSNEKKYELATRAKKIINEHQLSELSGVIEMLQEQENGDSYSKQARTYYILIDKLDERWVDESIRFKLIRALIESLKAFRRITKLKIVVSLRLDVLERVVQETQDLSFQREKYDAYFIKMRWTKDLLKQVIQKRIRELFRRRYSPKEEVEFEDVFPYRVGNIDPFDYLLDRTLMRPRDIIAFVNQCINESEGSYEISAAHIRQAEKEYSRVRREALEQEWRSAFPTLRQLLDFAALPKRESFDLETLASGDQAEKLALEIAAAPKKDFDPIHMAATLYVDSSDKFAFLREVLAVLYRVGAVGLKLRPNERFSYSHIDEPIISAKTIPDTVRLRIHPMLHAALALSPL